MSEQDDPIRWKAPTPFCTACELNWCRHVVDRIRERSDFLMWNPLESEIVVPLSALPVHPHTVLPKVSVKLIPLADDSTVEVRCTVDGVSHMLLYLFRDTECVGHTYMVETRRDIIEALTPFMAAWELEHPCRCEFINANLASLPGQQALAQRAAYRFMHGVGNFRERCEFCDDSDLVPDLTPTKSPFPRKSAPT